MLNERRQTMRSLRVAYDNDGLWDWGKPDDIPSNFARMVDQYVAVGAPFLAWGVGSHLAWNFRPTVMEAAWEEPSLPGMDGWHLAQWDTMKELAARGTDPLSMLLEQTQRSGLPIMANFRFNRYHPELGMADRWFVEHPQFHLSPESCPWMQTATNPRTSQALINLEHAEVREHLVRGLVDVAEHYPVDGLQLELMRAIPFFELDEPAKVEHMNAFLRLLQAELDRIGQDRDKRVKLALWLPTEGHHRYLRGTWPEPFLDEANWGLDPATWIEVELVDILIPSLYSQDLAMTGLVPLPWWVARARERSTEVYGCVMNISTKVKDGVTSCAKTAEILRSVSDQCDGVFLFNSQPLHLAAVLDVAQRTQSA